MADYHIKDGSALTSIALSYSDQRVAIVQTLKLLRIFSTERGLSHKLITSSTLRPTVLPSHGLTVFPTTQPKPQINGSPDL